MTTKVQFLKLQIKPERLLLEPVSSAEPNQSEFPKANMQD